MKKNWLMQHLSVPSLCVLLVIVFLSTTAVFGQTIQLPQTGQTKCWDMAGTEVTCAGTGQDGEYRMGASWPNPRFAVTYCNASGPCADQAEDCDGNGANDVVTDNLTGLMWARNGNLTDARVWDDAIDYANGLTLCGYTDWLLPNIIELESLLNADESNQASRLNAQGFLDVQPTGYWSSTTFKSISKNDKWSVDMSYMGVGHGSVIGTYSIWPVRGITTPPAELWKTGRDVAAARTGDDGDLHRGVLWPDPRFTVTYCNAGGPCIDQTTDCDGNGANDVVTDNLTGLIWTKSAVLHTATSWQDALDYANNLTLCGEDDWRLPNIKEVFSVIDWFTYDPCLPLEHPFATSGSSACWSSTSNPAYPNNAWAFKLNDETYSAAGPGFTGKNNATMMAWPVRGGSRPVSNFTLTIARSGSGSGTAISEAAGITCGTDCEEAYPAGTQVTLSATADTSSIFTGWSGGGCSGTGTCQVTMDNDVTVIATFALLNPVPSLSPAEGTIGTELTIGGSGFGTKKGKVLVNGIAAKIGQDGWTPNQITCTINNPPLPVDVAHPVTVVVNKVSTPLNDTFTVRNPTLNPLIVRRGIPGTPITVTGKFFATKKGKAYLEDPVSGKKKTCKITYWYMNPANGDSTLTFEVPKLPNGFSTGVAYPLKITNKVGTIQTTFTVDPTPP